MSEMDHSRGWRHDNPDERCNSCAGPGTCGACDGDGRLSEDHGALADAKRETNDGRSDKKDGPK
jgi:hypothetical protein